MGSLLNRYCRSGRCESQYFLEEGADRKDGKTKIFTFKEGIKRIKEIGKDDPEYKERNVKDRVIDGIIDWGYNMYGIFLIDADEVEDYKEGGSENFDDNTCDFSGMSKEELIYYVYGDDVEEMEEDYDIESLREQAMDICREAE